jgi:hypothetical protein
MLVHECCNVFEGEAESQSPLDEAKALHVFRLKSKIVGPATLPSRRLQQSTLPVETHIIDTHADGPSQFDESERPRSHLPPKQENAPPAPGKRAILDWERSQ